MGLGGVDWVFFLGYNGFVEGSVYEPIKEEPMTTNLAKRANPFALTGSETRDTRYRIGKYNAYLATSGTAWDSPNLAAYRDHLLATLAPATVAAHLGTVRARYSRLLLSNEIRDHLYSRTPTEASPADKKAFVDESLLRLTNAVHPGASKVKVPSIQDQADEAHLRLTASQAASLLASPGTTTLMGKRDTALIALLLCTGAREGELVTVQVDNLRASLGNEPGLLIRQGKGQKQRISVYGELDWCLPLVDDWLASASITQGPVIRGFYKGRRRLRPGPITTRAVEKILKGYPITVAGETRTVTAHDLRRTYARRQHDAGTPLVVIQQNLGHADIKTTMRYIGELDGQARRARQCYDMTIVNGVLAGAGKHHPLTLPI